MGRHVLGVLEDLIFSHARAVDIPAIPPEGWMGESGPLRNARLRAMSVHDATSLVIASHRQRQATKAVARYQYEKYAGRRMHGASRCQGRNRPNERSRS